MYWSTEIAAVYVTMVGTAYHCYIQICLNSDPLNGLLTVYADILCQIYWKRPFV